MAANRAAQLSRQLFAACDILAESLEGGTAAERRRMAALTLARLLFRCFAIPPERRVALPSAALLPAALPLGIAEPNQRQAVSQPTDAALARAQDILAALPRGALTPSILGTVFERYVERKQTGIYYTGDDVSGYMISRTILPRLFDLLAPDSVTLLADLTRRDPLRYIPIAMRHGAAEALPAEARLNRDAPAPPAFGLPGETWRDVLQRRERLAEIVAALRDGSSDPARLITLNLELPALARDLCAKWPIDRLEAIDAALERLTILDPTCGGGAFLCAAFDLLAELVDTLAARNAAYPRARRLRALIEQTLHGVDLMGEASEICRMQLWLRLIAAVPADVTPPARWNIHCGDILRDRDRWAATFAAGGAGAGFDIVVGNPPYVANAAIRHDPELGVYRTLAGGNLYALVVERGLELLRPGGRLGMIVPIASVATDGMAALQQLYAPYSQWHSHYAVRPGKLFADVDMNLTITLLHQATASPERYVSGYRRWRSRERARLFATLSYTPLPAPSELKGRLPKLGSPRETRLLQRMLAHGRRLGEYTDPRGVTLYYHSGGRYWRKALPEKLSSHYKPLRIAPAYAPIALALLNSQLFYWYWIAFSNCMDVVAREVLELPVFRLEEVEPAPFADLVEQLLRLYRAGATTRARRGTRIQVHETQLDARRARVAIDAIDKLLAHHYGFDDQELDFILSYDLPYRLGAPRRHSAD